MNIKDQLAAVGVDIFHHFGAGVYIKETHVPAGRLLVQHKHKYDHLSVLCHGVVQVTVDGHSEFHEGPKVLLIEANKVHSIESVTDALWLCVHGTDETDPEKVDEATAIEGSF